MPSKKAAILVVDDDVRILRMVKRMMELEDFRVLVASSGEAALKTFDSETPEAVLLDIMMPDMDGHTVCRRLREFSPVPIIMVTARGDDNEKVTGLDNGADDYVTKPFSASELAARVRAVLRRAGRHGGQTETVFRYQGLTIDFTAHRVTLGGRELELTPTEYRLLSYVCSNAGRVVTPNQLLDNVWGKEYVGDPHLLQVNIARLRHKLGDDARNPTYILTRSGIGYMMARTS